VFITDFDLAVLLLMSERGLSHEACDVQKFTLVKQKTGAVLVPSRHWEKTRGNAWRDRIGKGDPFHDPFLRAMRSTGILLCEADGCPTVRKKEARMPG